MPTPSVSTPEQVERRRWIALAVCCSALFMTLLDLSITNVALPSIGDATGAGPAELQWVVSGYTLAFGLVPVLGGRLGDDHGRRLMFIVGVAGFVVTSALSGLSPNSGLLIVARVLQGLSGGLINPQVSGLVQQMFRGRDRGRAFGVIGTVVALGTALGPLVGGALIALGGPDFGWRLVFFVNIPIGLAVIVLARRWLPDPPATGQQSLDIIGALVLGLATFCILFSAVEYDAVRDDRLFLLGIPALVLLLVFVRREARLTRERRDPLVDLRLFRQPSFTAGVAVALVFFCGMTGLPLVLALYYQQGLGYSALESGLGITAFAVGSAIAAPAAGRVVTRVGRPLVVGACLTFGVGALALDVVARHQPGGNAAVAFAVPLFVLGLGAGGLITPNQTLTLVDVDPVVGSTAGGVLQTSQRIGAAIGQAVIGATFFAALPAGAIDLVGTDRTDAYGHALSQAVVVTLLFVGAALLVGLTDLFLTRRRRLIARNGAHRDAPVAQP
ncbi:MAG TPA: MFS transporter [Nocardioidaceae bacterium]|jgi:EmrB/QacA subfamily drug resistance transporter